MYFECSMTVKFILADIEYHINCRVNVAAEDYHRYQLRIVPYLIIHSLTKKDVHTINKGKSLEM